MQLLAAAQMAERRQALAAVEASFRSRHASATAAVVARYADRRAGLRHIPDAGARAAEGQRLAYEEASELARLAVEHAAEKRQARRAALAALLGAHRTARRQLRRSHRHQRTGIAIQLRSGWPGSRGRRSATSTPVQRKVRLPRGLRLGSGGQRQ